jgi:hypothetical protein
VTRYARQWHADDGSRLTVTRPAGHKRATLKRFGPSGRRAYLKTFPTLERAKAELADQLVNRL